MIRNACAFRDGRLCATDVEAAIELDRVVVDDLATKFFCETNSELRLAGAGRTGDHDDAH